MSYRIGATISRYKHMIVIGLALFAIGSYFLPLGNVFAANHNTGTGHTNNANAKIRAALTDSSAHTSKTTTPKDSKTTTPKDSKTTTPTNNGNPNTNRIPSGKDGPNGAQIGGPDDNGNIGHGNTGTGSTGNFNNGDNAIGNFNNNPPGQTGNFCGNGAGHHYGCIIHNPHFTG